MNKIHNADGNARIYVTHTPDMLHFYYRPLYGKELYLYSTPFSLSIYLYFNGRGKTLRELYKFSDWDNPKLVKTISRLPGAVTYAIKEESYYADCDPDSYSSRFYA